MALAFVGQEQPLGTGTPQLNAVDEIPFFNMKPLKRCFA